MPRSTGSAMQPSRVQRDAAFVMWGVLCILTLIGAAAVFIVCVLGIEQLRHCNPPQPDSAWARECDMNTEAGILVALFGLPFLLPLPIALLIRHGRRKRA